MAHLKKENDYRYAITANELYHHMCTIINYAYGSNEPKLRTMKHFYIDLSDKMVKTKISSYSKDTNTIHLYNLQDNEMNNIAALFHETAHHIQWITLHTHNHTEEYYDILKKILNAALDLNKLNGERFLKQLDNNFVGYKEIQKIIVSHVPKDDPPEEYIPDLVVVSVKKSFAQKDWLLKEGFFWNAFEKTRQKTVKGKNLWKTIRPLLQRGIQSENILVREANVICFKKEANKQEVLPDRNLYDSSKEKK